jgi:hypothetical protein
MIQEKYSYAIFEEQLVIVLPTRLDRESFFSRRAFPDRAGASAGATVALASGGLLLRTGQTAAAQQADLDPAILNFASPSADQPAKS